jgi:CRISPR-associated protein Cmr6
VIQGLDVALRNGHTGGLVTFFDAVPAPQERNLLETDLLNPHYPEFYRDPARVPPSDDQNPTPVYFLAVRHGAVFEFPFLLADWPEGEPRDEAELQRAAALGETTRSTVLSEVRGWLTDGLKAWGAGAKTAAGYGYFEIIAQADPEPRS